jgi:hypothetical protein
MGLCILFVYHNHHNMRQHTGKSLLYSRCFVFSIFYTGNNEKQAERGTSYRGLVSLQTHIHPHPYPGKHLAFTRGSDIMELSLRSWLTNGFDSSVVLLVKRGFWSNEMKHVACHGKGHSV